MVECWSWYRVVSEGDEVFFYLAVSANDAELLYNEEHFDPFQAHTHASEIKAVDLPLDSNPACE